MTSTSSAGTITGTDPAQAPTVGTPVPFARALIAPEAAEAVTRVLASGWVTTGPECAAFEQELASWVGARHGIAVSSCTAALELSLRGLRLPRRARVLVPAITFCGAVEAVLHAGLVPVLADVDPRSGEMTPTTCRAAARAAGGVDALMVLHFAGAPAEVFALAEAADVPLEHVVEDAAHGLGTELEGRRVGSLSRATCFSFYATKNLPIGEGGMVTTDDDRLAEWLRSARLHGMSADAWRRYLPGGSWRYDVREAGLKANLPDVAAAVGRVQLRHLDGWQRRRADLAARYTVALRDLPGLVLPTEPARGRHAWHLYVIRITRAFGLGRDDVVTRLAELGIGTSVHFIPLHHLARYREVALAPTGLPGADAVFEETLSLPLHPGLADAEVDAVCAALGALRPLADSLEVGL